MAVWRGVCRAKKKTYFSVPPTRARPKKSLFTTAPKGEYEDSWGGLRAEVSALTEHLTTLRNSRHGAQEIAERHLQETEALAQRIDMMSARGSHRSARSLLSPRR